MNYKIMEIMDEGKPYWYACPDTWLSKLLKYDYLSCGIDKTFTGFGKEACKKKLDYYLKGSNPKIVETIKGE